MSTFGQLGRRLVGGGALLVLATSAAFFVPRTADPLASRFFDPFTI